MIHRIDPLTRLGSRLPEVEKPARYTGGEYGIYAKEGTLKTAVVFPDLYELGMSNQAFRIIYNCLNRMEGISCDRAFAPAPDFEKLLEEEGLPLYGLDTGIALAGMDLLLFTLGYELGITGILTVLGSSRIALRCSERGSGDPIVIMGGPCVSNPLPYALFVDAFWIGEAEAGFFDLAGELLALKRNGASRKDLLDHIAAHPHIWTPGKTNVRRAVAADFGREPAETSQGISRELLREPAVFPISSIKTVHPHGAVEIMRGCPNGCRFCHAGMWYRPMRQKRADIVMEEVEAFVRKGGYREISLSSLSTGDYCHITGLTAALNDRYGGRHVSFQLPSLRVSGFSLPLLAAISEVRKSGLTFAVETPAAADQISLNKEVALSEVVSIIGEAKKYGWRGAKFYFMIGLPLPGSASGNEREEEGIVDFILQAGKAASSHFTLNVGTFVPKPHTPYQRASQLDEEAAWKKLNYIRERLKPRGHKVSAHSPFVSLLEGIFARGTENSGLLAETAYRQGCRLDAWSEYIQTDIWRDIIRENTALVEESLRARDATEKLPWAVIQSGVGEGYLEEENSRSELSKTTPPCLENCGHRCGICGGNNSIVNNNENIPVNKNTPDEKANIAVENPQTISDETDHPRHGTKSVRRLHDVKSGLPDGDSVRMLFSFSKKDTAVFVPHLGVIEVFSAAVVRSGLPAVYTQGFNPLLKVDFAAPAPLGLSCACEIASMDLEESLDPNTFIRQINAALPAGFSVNAAELFVIPGGAKKYSVSSVLWGFRYGEDLVPAKEEKEYRLAAVAAADAAKKNFFGLTRDGVFAKSPGTGDPSAEPGGKPVDYFDLYRNYYKQNQE